MANSLALEKNIDGHQFLLEIVWEEDALEGVYLVCETCDINWENIRFFPAEDYDDDEISMVSDAHAAAMLHSIEKAGYA